jgi:hypothetical protein
MDPAFQEGGKKRWILGLIRRKTYLRGLKPALILLDLKDSR